MSAEPDKGVNNPDVGQDDSVEFQAPGFSFKGRGDGIFSQGGLLNMLVALSLVAGGWFMYQHTGDTRDTNAELRTTLKELVQVQRENNCIISLPQDRREANAELCKRIAR